MWDYTIRFILHSSYFRSGQALTKLQVKLLDHLYQPVSHYTQLLYYLNCFIMFFINVALVMAFKDCFQLDFSTGYVSVSNLVNIHVSVRVDSKVSLSAWATCLQTPGVKRVRKPCRPPALPSPRSEPNTSPETQHKLFTPTHSTHVFIPKLWVYKLPLICVFTTVQLSSAVWRVREMTSVIIFSFCND